MSLRCSSCNINFNDKGSLEVHYSYTHSALVPDGARPAEPDADSGQGSNNNNNNNNNNNQHYFKYESTTPTTSDHSVMTAISPGADTRDFHHPAPVHHCAERLYDLPPPTPQHHYEHFLNSEYARPPMQNANYAFNDHRYHPYYKQTFRELHTPLHRCDKCQLQLPSHEMLLQHMNIVHTPAGSGLGTHHFHRFGNPVVNGNEPQAEILDLDSHKVHVYQPPNGEDSQDSDHRSMDPWGREDKKFYHQQQLHLQNGQQPLPNGMTNGRNGGGGTPLPSPDFGNVSTTTESIENVQATRSPFYEPATVAAASTPSQISSSANPTRGSKSSKSSNGNWKSNEARRPKTYNCSACNKWFTSSGHLKRHYNTTLHKNAVKQSGAPDPATLPVSAHHHPQKDPTYTSSRQIKSESRTESQTSPKLEPPFHNSNTFMLNSPNLMAGPSEVAGGLLHPSYSQSPADHLKSPAPVHPSPTAPVQPLHPTPHSNMDYLGFVSQPPSPPPPPPPPQFFHQTTPTMLYPNFKSPHVSTSRQVTQSSLTGNLSDEIESWNAEFLSTLEPHHGDVGGVDNATELLMNDLLDEEETNVTSSTIDTNSGCSSSSVQNNAKMAEFSCEKCHKFFNKACYLTQHNKSFHSGFKPFKCSRCGKRFPDGVQFKVHSDKHAGDKPYKCEICPKAFNHKTDLRRHACLHTDVRPYTCDICKKGFIRKDHMHKHRETHQNKKTVQRKLKVQKLKKELELMEMIC